MQTVPQNGGDSHLPVMGVGGTEGTADEQDECPALLPQGEMKKEDL